MRFDSSCSFSAKECAGALTPWVDGSLHVKNIINSANVTGSYRGVGGLIGHVQGPKEGIGILSQQR